LELPGFESDQKIRALGISKITNSDYTKQSNYHEGEGRVKTGDCPEEKTQRGEKQNKKNPDTPIPPPKDHMNRRFFQPMERIAKKKKAEGKKGETSSRGS